jgi:hypothetical protein
VELNSMHAGTKGFAISNESFHVQRPGDELRHGTKAVNRKSCENKSRGTTEINTRGSRRKL